MFKKRPLFDSERQSIEMHADFQYGIQCDCQQNSY